MMDPAAEMWQEAFDFRLDFMFADLSAEQLPSALPGRR